MGNEENDRGTIYGGKQAQGHETREQDEGTRASTNGQASKERPASANRKNGEGNDKKPHKNTGGKNGRRRQGRSDDETTRTTRGSEVSRERR